MSQRYIGLHANENAAKTGNAVCRIADGFCGMNISDLCCVWPICCRVVKPLAPVIRPKGLGLGADKSILLQTSNSKQKHQTKSAEENELVLKCGSYCMLLGGKHDGLYGTVRLFIVILCVFCVDHKTVRSNSRSCFLCSKWGWPQTWKTWNTPGFVWTWKTQGILGEFCAASEKF